MMTQLPISMAGLMALLLVLFQDSACSHFFCTLPIAASPLSARLDVLILALLFFAYARYSSLFRHGSSRCNCRNCEVSSINRTRSCFMHFQVRPVQTKEAINEML